MSLLSAVTPLEAYEVQGRRVWVKREDLATNPPAPALAKLRGVLPHLERVKAAGRQIVGVLDTRISKSGWGVAAVARELGGLEVWAFYPALKADAGRIREQEAQAQRLGAKLCPLKGGRCAILYARARRVVEEAGGYMMPMGLVVRESVVAIAGVAQALPEEVRGGDVVLSVGSGMTVAGIAMGAAKRMHRIYGISAGMATAKQHKRIQTTTGLALPLNVRLILPEGVGYFDCEQIATPFPSSPYYDKKAWRWLENNLDSLRDPVLFWNIGT